MNETQTQSGYCQGCGNFVQEQGSKPICLDCAVKIMSGEPLPSKKVVKEPAD